MHTVRSFSPRFLSLFLVPLSLILLAADTPSAGGPGQQPGEIKLEVVKYNQLVEAIKAQRGKVVVVDVWSTLCIPCMKEFPNLIQLQQRYGRNGLVCMSVTIDELQKQQAALAFLQRQGASIPNFLLDEDPAVWEEKWDVKSVPIVFVIGRDGQRAAKFNSDDPQHDFTYADVEKLVQQLLPQNP